MTVAAEMQARGGRGGSAPRRLRILMVAAEASPLIKTGGLADAVSGLAAALAGLGHDLRVLVPAYRSILEAGWRLEPEAGFRIAAMPGTRLLHTELPRSGVGVWLVDHPSFAQRAGGPYADAAGREYPDNDVRFDRMNRVATRIAGARAGLDWCPDVVHAHDWHAGLLPVHMLLERVPTPVVFTIHNLAYQGLFPAASLDTLGLPHWLWHPDALEYYGRLSCMKGGLQFADLLTTVSPTFAREILTATYGEGLEGVIRQREGDLSGILNGLNQNEWNPESDSRLVANYSSRDLGGKRANRTALRKKLGLAERKDRLVVAMIGRLVAQKGVDLLLSALPDLLKLPLQIAVLGSGDSAYETALSKAAAAHPKQMSVTLGFDEDLAHLLEAGADVLLMPSRYEPCGLAQMQSMRYGTVPVVRGCGGLLDTVVDADAARLAQGTATGFVFEPATAPALLEAVGRALAVHRKRAQWESLMRAGMHTDFSWRRSAEAYSALYDKATSARRGVQIPGGTVAVARDPHR